ncbi:glycosyltransferase family 1 protein [Mycena filopes]|nr:glycosyltransferase family 1 protein [Mycena filopes]
MLLLALVLAVAAICRILWTLPSHRRPVSRANTKSLAVFLGSGGHTSEALTLLSALDFARYSPRTYVISEGDSFSAQKARDLELSKETGPPLRAQGPAQYTLLTIPRARRVRQVPPHHAIDRLGLTFIVCLPHYRGTLSLPFRNRPPFADVLILNGPGTCFTLCIAVYVNKFLGLPAPRVIYIESFARVDSLSLSGKLLYPFVDRFIVQWKQLQEKVPGAEFRGLLV